jgi:hypothetical protein
MKGRIESGDLVTVEPLGEHTIKRGNIVLCRVRSSQYLHIVKGLRKGQVLIGNNKGGTNGWTTIDKVYGICTKVES